MRSPRRTAAPFASVLVVVAVAALLLSGCSSSKKSLVVAGSDFAEQDVVANIYAGALRAKGFSVTVKPHLGKREVVQPALQKGDVDILPEYVGSLLEYLQAGSSSSDLSASVTKLKSLLAAKKLTALDPAPAYDADALVVTKATADKYHLVKVSDLAAVASQLTFGGPPECPTRPLCQPGYKTKYGLSFKSFKPLDVGGPLTKQALTGNSIDVGLLFSSDIPDNTVVLVDDKGLQPAENIIPVLRTVKTDAKLTAALNAVSKELTLAELVDLNKKVTGDQKQDPADAAADWLKEYKLG
jgi:osmoprotectant transport system substrate-binding protein